MFVYRNTEIRRSQSKVKSSRKNNYSVGLSTRESNQGFRKGGKIIFPCHVSNVPFVCAQRFCVIRLKISLSNFRILFILRVFFLRIILWGLVSAFTMNFYFLKQIKGKLYNCLLVAAKQIQCYWHVFGFFVRLRF